MRKAEIVINAIVAKKTNSADLSRITNIDAEQGTVELNGEKILKIASIVSHYNFVEMYVAQEEAQTNEEQVEEEENNEVLTSYNSQEEATQENKRAKTSNDILIQALEEVLRGAKKIDVCRKYDIPNYRFSRVLNMKYLVTESKYTSYVKSKLDWIKNIELIKKRILPLSLFFYILYSLIC